MAVTVLNERAIGALGGSSGGGATATKETIGLPLVQNIAPIDMPVSAPQSAAIAASVAAAKAASLADTQGVAASALTGGAATAATFLGVVGTRCKPPSHLNTDLGRINTRAIHYTPVPIYNPKMLFGGWFVDSNNVEQAAPMDSTIRASFGFGSTVARAPFGGADEGVIPAGGRVWTDRASIVIPAGFYWTQHSRVAASLPFCNNMTSSGGDYFNWVNADLTMLTEWTGANAPAPSTPSGYAPLAIVGETSLLSTGIIGDSRNFGDGQDPANAPLDTGEVSPIFAPLGGYINAARSNDSCLKFLASSSRRVELLREMFSHSVVALGINDLRGSGSLTATGLFARRMQIAAMFPGLSIIHTTLTPAESTVEARRVAFNDMIRSLPPGQFIDVADAVETSRNSGVRKAGYSTDNVHENINGYNAIRDYHAGRVFAANPSVANRILSVPDRALIAPASGWAVHDVSNYGPATVRIDSSKNLVLSGWLTGSDYSDNRQIAQLPAGMRPGFITTRLAPTSQGYCRLMFHPSGSVTIMSGGYSYIDLGGLTLEAA